MATPKYTIHDFNRDYPDDDACFVAITEMLYPEGMTCRTCERIRPHSRITGRRAYACAGCGTHVYPLAGTIFAKSTTPLKSWFYAMYLMASTRCGISAKQLERELGVTYKTAWRMFTQIRKLMDEDGGPLSGEVEIDETFIGGRARGQAPKQADGKRRTGRRPNDGKITVIGAVERGGRVHARAVPNRKIENLLPLVVEHVMPTSTVFTDEAHQYKRLPKQGYTHHRINHGARVYVKGNVHTNTIEGFWSLLKNGIVGVHHAVGGKYLQSYVDEYAFRYNHRHDARHMFHVLSGRMTAVRYGNFGGYAPIGQ